MGTMIGVKGDTRSLDYGSSQEMLRESNRVLMALLAESKLEDRWKRVTGQFGSSGMQDHEGFRV